MERVLAIDTSGSACSIALIDQGDIVCERHEEIGRGHAEIIIPWISALPNGGKADAVIVGCGPGSFTGLRVGIAAARALGLAWTVPVYGCSSLALVAQSSAVDGTLLVAVEGGHGELFVQMFDCGRMVLECSALSSLLPGDAASLFQPQFIAGSGAGRFREAGGLGQIVPGMVRAALAPILPNSLKTLRPSPIYGRGADAKPMAQ